MAIMIHQISRNNWCNPLETIKPGSPKFMSNQLIFTMPRQTMENMCHGLHLWTFCLRTGKVSRLPTTLHANHESAVIGTSDAIYWKQSNLVARKLCQINSFSVCRDGNICHGLHLWTFYLSTGKVPLRPTNFHADHESAVIVENNVILYLNMGRIN